MNKSPKTLDEKMIVAQSGDAKIYSEVLQEISILARKIISARVNKKDDIEDIIQEILISVHKSRHTYDGARPFKPWVRAIISFRLNDYFRKYYKTADKEYVDYDSVSEQLFEPSSQENVTFNGYDRELINKALANLPEKQRNIVKLMKIEGYTAKEVADQLGMSISAVKVSAHRSYKKLKDELEKLIA